MPTLIKPYTRIFSLSVQTYQLSITSQSFRPSATNLPNSGSALVRFSTTRCRIGLSMLKKSAVRLSTRCSRSILLKDRYLSFAWVKSLVSLIFWRVTFPAYHNRLSLSHWIEKFLTHTTGRTDPVLRKILKFSSSCDFIIRISFIRIIYISTHRASIRFHISLVYSVLS